MWIRWRVTPVGGGQVGDITEVDDEVGESAIETGLAEPAPDRIRLHMLASFVGHGFTINPGDRVERDRDEACRLIAAGFAIPVVEPVTPFAPPVDLETTDARVAVETTAKRTRRKRAS